MKEITSFPSRQPAVTRAEIEGMLAGSSFMQGFDFRLEALGWGTCALRYPYHPRHDRPGGVVTGIVMLAAADLAMWFAIMTQVGRAAADHSVTVELKTCFLRGARGDIVTTASLVEQTPELILGVCEAHDAGGSLVAHHVASYVNPARDGG